MWEGGHETVGLLSEHSVQWETLGHWREGVAEAGHSVPARLERRTEVGRSMSKFRRQIS